MKFKKITFKLLIALIVSLMLFASFAYAVNEENEVSETNANDIALISAIDETQPIVDADFGYPSTSTSEIKNGDVFTIEDSVTIDYPVSGNVYIIAQEVNINSVIDGNIFILASKVNIQSDAYIYSDAYICTEDLTVDGYIYDLYSMSSTLTIGQTGYIIRDLSAGCDTFNLEGTIKRTANLSANVLNISSDTAEIGEDFNYTSSNEISVTADVVGGTVTFTQAESENKKVESVALSYLKDVFKTLCYALIAIIVIVFAIPKASKKLESQLTTKFWPTFGYGTLTLIAVPVAILILFASIFGIWASLLLLFAYIFVFTISASLLSVALGKYICTKMNKDSSWFLVLISILLVLAIWILKLIPFLGVLVSIVVNILGFGLLTTALFPNKKAKVTTSEKKEPVEADTTSNIVVDTKDQEKADSNKKSAEDNDSEKKD